MPRPKFIPINLTPQQSVAFWKRVDGKSSDECWPWSGWCNSHGYGVFNRWISSKKGYGILLAHRIAYVLTYCIQPEMCVLHTCDNPPCCNPKHLYDGTDLQNVTDRESRNRSNPPIGSRSFLAKLTEEQVAIIKQRLKIPGVNMSAIAREHGVTPGVIHRINAGKTWKHVE